MGAKLPNTLVAQRYKVCVKTIMRWIEAGIIDPPEKINGRYYHDEEKLEARERERMAKVAAA